MAETRQPYRRIGRVTKPRGIKGEVKVVVYVDEPEILDTFDVLYLGRGRQQPRLMPLQQIRFHQGFALILFEGVADRNEAELLRGMDVFVPEEWMPPLEEGEYYVYQIEGLRVITVDGEELGTVQEVLFTGANEVYVVQGEKYGEVLLPAIEDVVREIDLEAGELRVQLLEGLI